MCDDNDEPTIPRAALNKLIKDNAPHIRVANETRDLLHTCCLEFVKLVANEANQICIKEQRKTISHEHAVKALDQLGFGPAYQEAATSVLDQCKEAAQKRLKRLNSRLEKCGVPVEELQKQQEQLFEKARLEQAELEQSQMAWFYQQRELAARQMQATAQNEPKTAPADTNSVPVGAGIDSLPAGHNSLPADKDSTHGHVNPGRSEPELPQHPKNDVSDSSRKTKSNQISVITSFSSPVVLKKPKFGELDEDYDNPE